MLGWLFNRNGGSSESSPTETLAVTPTSPRTAKEVAPSIPVVIYSTTWCGSCKIAKKYFSSRGIPFEEIDIDGNRDAAEAVMRWAGGFRTVPIMIIGKFVVVDWDRKAVRKALADAGWQEQSNL